MEIWGLEGSHTEVRELIGQVIQEMEKHLSMLSATDCSRLAWLYLNIGNSERARDAAKKGLQKQPENEYCQKLIQRLDS